MFTFAAKIVHFMEIAGYIASVLIGISLGLIGGGGSILTLPVLVYLFGIDVYLATAYSLFIVGISSSVGSVFYYIKGLVNLKTAIIFGIPSIISIFLTRKFLLPVIPDITFADSGTVISKNMMLLFLFALLMILASYKMIQNKNASEQKNTIPKKKKKKQWNFSGKNGFHSGRPYWFGRCWWWLYHHSGTGKSAENAYENGSGKFTVYYITQCSFRVFFGSKFCCRLEVSPHELSDCSTWRGGRLATLKKN